MKPATCSIWPGNWILTDLMEYKLFSWWHIVSWMRQMQPNMLTCYHLRKKTFHIKPSSWLFRWVPDMKECMIFHCYANIFFSFSKKEIYENIYMRMCENIRWTPQITGSEWVIKFNGLSGESGHRGPYKHGNHSLYIEIIIFIIRTPGTWIHNYIPQHSVGRNYLSMP